MSVSILTRYGGIRDLASNSPTVLSSFCLFLSRSCSLCLSFSLTLDLLFVSPPFHPWATLKKLSTLLSHPPKLQLPNMFIPRIAQMKLDVPILVLMQGQ